MSIQDHIREIRKHLDAIENYDKARCGASVMVGINASEKPSVPMKECPDCKGKGGSFYGSEPPPPGAHGSWRYCKRCNGIGKVVAT